MNPEARRASIKSSAKDPYLRGPLGGAVGTEQADTDCSQEEASARVLEWYETELQAIETRKRTGDPVLDALEVLEQYRYPRAWAIFAARHDADYAGKCAQSSTACACATWESCDKCFRRE